ncbi:hypothetical protein OIV83_003553 [Microbotryomycetes sp. JL201]|nr:hypothetical protein OIV83_003553 [Microbotryomycetes sp. JL201]
MGPLPSQDSGAAMQAIDELLHEAQAQHSRTPGHATLTTDAQSLHTDTSEDLSSVSNEAVLRRRLLEAQKRLELSRSDAVKAGVDPAMALASATTIGSTALVARPRRSSASAAASVPSHPPPPLLPPPPTSAAAATSAGPQHSALPSPARIQELPEPNLSQPPANLSQPPAKSSQPPAKSSQDPIARLPAKPTNAPQKTSETVSSIIQHLALANVAQKKLLPLLELTTTVLRDVINFEQEAAQRITDRGRQSTDGPGAPPAPQAPQAGPSSALRASFARDVSSIVADAVRRTLDETLEDWRLTVVSSLQVLENKVDQIAAAQQQGKSLHPSDPAYTSSNSANDMDEEAELDIENQVLDDNEVEDPPQRDNPATSSRRSSMDSVTPAQHSRSMSGREITILSTAPASPRQEAQDDALATSTKTVLDINMPDIKASCENGRHGSADDTSPLVFSPALPPGADAKGVSTAEASHHSVAQRKASQQSEAPGEQNEANVSSAQHSLPDQLRDTPASPSLKHPLPGKPTVAASSTPLRRDVPPHMQRGTSSSSPATPTNLLISHNGRPSPLTPQQDAHVTAGNQQDSLHDRVFDAPPSSHPIGSLPMDRTTSDSRSAYHMKPQNNKKQQDSKQSAVPNTSLADRFEPKSADSSKSVSPASLARGRSSSEQQQSLAERFDSGAPKSLKDRLKDKPASQTNKNGSSAAKKSGPSEQTNKQEQPSLLERFGNDAKDKGTSLRHRITETDANDSRGDSASNQRKRQHSNDRNENRAKRTAQSIEHATPLAERFTDSADAEVTEAQRVRRPTSEAGTPPPREPPPPTSAPAVVSQQQLQSNQRAKGSARLQPPPPRPSAPSSSLANRFAPYNSRYSPPPRSGPQGRSRSPARSGRDRSPRRGYSSIPHSASGRRSPSPSRQYHRYDHPMSIRDRFDPPPPAHLYNRRGGH